MPVESVFDRLEALPPPRCESPIQYVGGELNARTKDWESAKVRWALMYPDAYEVGVPNQGIQILYEVLNERTDALAERRIRSGPISRISCASTGCHSPSTAIGRSAPSICSALCFSTDSATRTCSRARPRRHPATPATARTRTRSWSPADTRVQPRADRRLRRRGLLATASSRLEITEIVRRGRPRAARAAATSCCSPGATGGVYVPRFYDVTTADGRSAVVPPARRPVAGPQAHRIDLDAWPYPEHRWSAGRTVHQRMGSRFSGAAPEAPSSSISGRS